MKREQARAEILRYFEKKTYASLLDFRRMGIAHQTATSVLSHLADEGIIFPTQWVDEEKDRTYTIWRFLKQDEEAWRKYARFLRWKKKLRKAEKYYNRVLEEFQRVKNEFDLEALEEVNRFLREENEKEPKQ